ncbi:MAG: FkbM family methyltransferase [Planctomycetota bacterium]
MLEYFKSTKFKMRVAHVLLSFGRLFGLKRKRIILRKGVRYEVDLAEGIDLHLFLFGGFQAHLAQSPLIRILEDAVILDVGANVGAVSLAFAKAFPRATIYSFEPSHYAFEKMKRNLELNEDLGKRIFPMQAFVTMADPDPSHLVAYASWPIDDLGGDRHPMHMGIMKEATDRRVILDEFVRERGIDRLNLIKIDTDGHEMNILRSAEETIRRFRPIIIFELTAYLLDERGYTFTEYEKFLRPQGYRLYESESGHEMLDGCMDRFAPKGGSIDVVAVPSSLPKMTSKGRG